VVQIKYKNMNKKILIVEDEQDFRMILQLKFESEGFSVSVAADGDTGIKTAEKEKPDIILSDILMPKMDGIQMIKKLKEKGNPAQVIFLTNFQDTSNIVGALEADKNADYIVKSNMNIGEIVDKVKEKLSRLPQK